MKNYFWMKQFEWLSLHCFISQSKELYNMADASSLVTSIEIKVQQLIVRQKTLIAENERYQQEIIELKQKIEEQLQDIQEKEKKLNVLKTVKILENKEGTVEAKAKIHELLREIDKCIGLLNT